MNLERTLDQPGKWLSRLRLSKKGLAIAAAVAFLLTTLPLFLISFYNHPFYDDFGFSVRIHGVWKETGSFWQAVAEAWRNMCDTRYTWQGTYTGTFLSGLQPGVFNEGLYFITTLVLLSSLILCFGYLFKVVFKDFLHADRWDFWLIASGLLFLMIQFLPDPDEGFFWFNGGIGNTFIYSLLALSLALCLRLSRARSAGKAAALMLALCALMVLLGGGSYGGGLFALLLLLCAIVWAYRRRASWRGCYIALFGLLLLCFLYNMTAPGNAVRAGYINYTPNALKSVLQALYYGTALMGNWLRLPVLAVTAALVPVFAAMARRTPYQFKHPFWLLLLGGGLFCSQLVPPLYSGVYIGGGRILNTYFFSFITLYFLYVFYLTGFIARRLERREDGGAAAESIRAAALKLRAPFVALVVLALFVGCLSFRQETDLSYGPQNMSGGSAMLSLLKGEARQYDLEMQKRERLLNDESVKIPLIAPLSVEPDVFMSDQLKPGAIYNVVPTIAEYYGKDDIVLLEKAED